MSKFNNLKDLATVLEMLDKHNVSEFKLELGEEKLFVRRGRAADRKIRPVHNVPQVMAPALPLPSNVIPLVNPSQAGAAQTPQLQPNLPLRDVPLSSVPASAAVVQTASAPAETILKKALKEITSPMVGTFYRRPAVDAEPYVQVGDTVKKGDVVCIVEAMKLMNEIESDTPGKIAEICLEDGQMVEYGEVLFRIEPF